MTTNSRMDQSGSSEGDGPSSSDETTVQPNGPSTALRPQGESAEEDDGGFTAFVEHVQLVTGSVTVVADGSRAGAPSSSSSQGRTAQRGQPRSPATSLFTGASPRAVRSSRQRGRRPEVLGLAVVLVLALLCAGVIWAVLVKTRNDADAAEREAASAPLAPSTAQPSSSGGVVIAVIGDESALRSADGVAAGGRWPQQLSDIAGARVSVLASTGAGYVATGTGGDDFADLAAKVPTAATAVVFVGGAADADASSLELAQAATEAVAAASQRAPDAAVLVVGPLFTPAGTADSEVLFVRNTLRSAARIAAVQFADPIRSGWLDPIGSASALTAADGRIVGARIDAALASSTG